MPVWWVSFFFQALPKIWACAQPPTEKHCVKLANALCENFWRLNFFSFFFRRDFPNNFWSFDVPNFCTAFEIALGSALICRWRKQPLAQLSIQPTGNDFNSHLTIFHSFTFPSFFVLLAKAAKLFLRVLCCHRSRRATPSLPPVASD